MAFTLVSVNDASVYDGKTLVINVTDAGTDKGPVVYGGVTQAPANVTWTNTTITVTDFDAGALPVDGSSYTLACYKPIAEEPAPAGDQWYVRSNSTTYGTGSGTDWNNAWSGMAGINWGSLAGGDQVWIAGGEYSDRLTVNGRYSSGARVSLRIARNNSTDCTGAAGWQAGFSSTIHHTEMISLGDSSTYITFSGRTETDTHGWHIDRKGETAALGIGLWNDSSDSYLLFEYFDIEGPGAINYTDSGRGIDATPFSTGTDITFSHMKIWDWESCVMVALIDNLIFEYVDISDAFAVNWETWHPNGIYIVGTSNGTVRYSTFRTGNHHGVGEGIFFQGGSNITGWKIYGNLFYDLVGTVKSISGKVPVQMEVYNNTFYNTSNTLRWVDSGTCAVGSAWINNMIVDGNDDPTCGTTSNNIKIGALDAPGTPDPFADKANKDFHIVSNTGGNYPRNAGVALSAEFSTDRDGNTRGADGTWDVGAYEYV